MHPGGEAFSVGHLSRWAENNDFDWHWAGRKSPSHFLPDKIGKFWDSFNTRYP